MSVYAGRVKIKDASKALRARWNSTKGLWRDEVSRNFEEKHLDPLLKKLRNAEEALSHMDEVLNQLRRDCR
ncbi:MAG: hypothetical protein ACYTF1_09390 [Planctomycetota bacterium]|jgi:hypothetical protein